MDAEGWVDSTGGLDWRTTLQWTTALTILATYKIHCFSMQ